MISCRYFKGDRPCKYYWIDKSWDCKICNHFSPYDKRILIIKLDALGDVIRSTPIAEGIKKKYPNCELSWVVDSEHKWSLENNTFINNIIPYTEENIRILQPQKFDIIINLDKDARANSIIMLLNSNEKLGYGMSVDGKVVPLNKEAEYQYNICLDNWGAKRTNTKTYIEMLFDISKLNYEHEKPNLFLDKSESLLFKEKFYEKYNIHPKECIIILNTGCGPIYPSKKWTYEGYQKLIELLLLDNYNRIILTGAKSERERNKNLYDTFNSNKIINTTEEYNIKELCHLIDLCDIIVTSDTMALHVAISLSKKIIAFFGMGPYKETDLFGLGIKMVREELECLMCHNQFKCPYDTKCMSLITAEDVYSEMKKLITV